MKKLLSTILAAAMIFTLTACGAPAADPAPEPDPEPSSVSEPESSSVPEPEPLLPEPEPVVVMGTVKEVSPSMLLLELADGTELMLNIKAVEGLEVKEGNIVIAEYLDTAASSVEVIGTAAELAPEPLTPEPVVSEPVQTAPNAASQAPAVKADRTYSGVVTGFSEYGATIFRLADGSDFMFMNPELIMEGFDRTLQIGDEVIFGETGTGFRAQITSITLVEPGTAASVGNDNSGKVSLNLEGGILQIKSTIDGDSNDKKQTFHFVLTFDDKSINGLYGSLTFKNGVAEFDLGDGIKSAAGVPVGTSYTIKQTDANKNGFTTDSIGETGVILANAWTYAEFRNMGASTGDVYKAIELINAERVKAGLKKLDIDSDIMEMAAIRASELAERYEHTRPDGRTCTSIFGDFGSSLKSYGENINAGWATASQAINSWMNSPPHKAHILNDSITRVGVGYFYSSDSEWKHYWVMLSSY